MNGLKKYPRNQAKVVKLQPKWIVLKEAQAYCGMGPDLMRRMIIENKLNVFASGTKKMWLKVEELDAMMESFKIISNKKAAASTTA